MVQSRWLLRGFPSGLLIGLSNCLPIKRGWVGEGFVRSGNMCLGGERLGHNGFDNNWFFCELLRVRLSLVYMRGGVDIGSAPLVVSPWFDLKR